MEHIIWYPGAGADLTPLVLPEFADGGILVCNDYNPYFRDLFGGLRPGDPWYRQGVFSRIADPALSRLWKRLNVGAVTVAEAPEPVEGDLPHLRLVFEVDGRRKPMWFVPGDAHASVRKLAASGCRLHTVVLLRGAPTSAPGVVDPLNSQVHFERLTEYGLAGQPRAWWTDQGADRLGELVATGQTLPGWGLGGSRSARLYRRPEG